MHRITQEIIKEEEQRKKPFMDMCRDNLSNISYWKQLGGIFKLYPRQSGKTTALKELIPIKQQTGKVVIIAPYQSMLDSFVERIPFYKQNQKEPAGTLKAKELGDFRYCENERLTTQMQSLIVDNYHLIIDEFTLLRPNTLNNLLEYLWKSVTAVGTLV